MRPKILSKKSEYKNNWLKIEAVKLKFPNGVVANWQKTSLTDFVTVIAIDKQKNIYFSKEWRLSWGQDVIQAVAGACPYKSEKRILLQARNELREEIGLDAKKWYKLTSACHNSRIKITVHIFLAYDLFPSKKKNEEDEIIETVKMPFNQAFEQMLSGKFKTTTCTMLGMLLAKKKLKI